MMRCLTRVLLLLAVGVSVAAAQASMVPVSHPVYDWLLEQRVDGRIPTYQHEVRPMSRATVIGHLRTLAAVADGMTGRERKMLEEFRNEFEMDRLAAKRGWTREFLRGLPGSIPGAIRDRLDPVLIAGTTKDSLVSGAVYASIGGGTLSLTQSGSTVSAYATSKAVRMFINTRFGLGWHLDWDNIWTESRRELIEQIPRYNTRDLKPFSTASFDHDGFLSYRAPKWFEMYMGWGGHALGASITDPLVLRGDGPTFGAMRLQFGGPRLNLVYLHGELASQTTDDTSGTPTMPIFNRKSPDRYFVTHRLTWMPFTRLSLSAHEEVIYANRGPDLNYLNPALPMYLTQLRMGDRDNLVVGGDAIYRPWNGTELRGSFVIDDRSAPNPDAPTFGPFKKAFLVGIEQRLVPGVRLGLGYTEIDPWAYTNWQRVNTYESEGKPLGPLIGPNAEELAVRITTWLPLRTRVMAGFRHIKKGMDLVGAATDTTKCVGGNLLCGTLKKETPLYQGADVHVINRRELEALTEPIKGFPVVLSVRDDKVTQGTQLVSSRFVNLFVRVGF